MRAKLHLAIITSLVLLNSCSGNKLVEIAHHAENETTIEGNFIAPPVYKYYSPAILFPKSNNVWIKYGKVIEKGDEGVLFVEKDKGLFDSGDTLYFRYDEMRAIVDSNRFCVWGELKDNEEDKVHFVFNLKDIDDPDYSPIYLDLIPDTNFAYSIRPGYYEITNIKMNYLNKDKDIFYISMPYKIGNIDIKEGVANYIGDIRIITDNRFGEATLVIPYKKQAQNVPIIVVPEAGLLANVIGGAAQGAMFSLISNMADTSGTFKFNVKFSKDYEGKGNNQIINTEIIPAD